MGKVTGWATEATPEAPARIVSGLAVNTDSIFCDGPGGPRQQMDVRFCEEQEPPAERHTCAAMNPERSACVLSRARPGHLCPLDK